MKSVSASLSAHLSGETTTLARLWKITRADGVVKGYTDWDQDISFADDDTSGGGSPPIDIDNRVQVLVNLGSTVGTQASATLTPQDSNDFLIYLTSYISAAGVPGWVDHGIGYSTLTPSGGAAVTATSTSSATDGSWVNIIGSFQTLGTPTQVQHGSGGGGGFVSGQTFHPSFALLPTTAGNRIFITFQSTTAAISTTPPLISDSFGNTYTLFGTTFRNPTTGVVTACWLWEAVNSSSGTLTIDLVTTCSTTSSVYDSYEYAGINPPLPPPPVTTTTYSSVEGFTASAVQHGSDGSADNLMITGFLSDDGINEHDVRAHLYDAATIEMRIVNWADLTQGALKLIKGTVGDITLLNGSYELELRGLTQLLSTQIGSTFSPLCRAELFGGGAEGIDPANHWKCRLNRADWVQTGTVASSPNSTQITPSGSGSPPVGLLMVGSPTPTDAAPAGWFDDGVITFTSGVLSGYSFEVGTWDGEQLFLFGGAPMPFSPAPGDAFEIEPGCDKNLGGDCSNKFHNSINHAGESAIPGLFQIGALSRAQIG